MSSPTPPPSSPPNKLKAVLFDVDGTMADTDVYHRRVFKDLLAPFHIDCDDAFYNAHISGKANHQLHTLLVPHLSTDAATELFHDKERRFRELAGPTLEPLDGFADFIRACSARGVRIAAVTNAPRKNVEMMLSKFGLAKQGGEVGPEGTEGHVGRLETIVLGDECAESKPSPLPYQMAMERLGVKPDECVVFEDSGSGVTAGVRAGCQVVGVLTTKTPAEMKALGCVGAIHSYNDIDIDRLITTMQGYLPPL